MAANPKTTIFALSSAPGRAAVAVVRISGPAAGLALTHLAGSLPAARRAALRRIVDPRSGALLDRGLVLWFPGPSSETGQDLAELHLHGGRAVVRSVLDALAGIEGCRPAEAGEFTRQAFENGRIDLVEAEGLADLIEAETEAQRRQAMRQAEGMLSGIYETWRSKLIEALALVEASIDFSDEADVSDKAFGQARSIVSSLEKSLLQHLDDGHRGEILREGFRVVLAGPPNVGKSSLLNALAKREAAIVSEEAGTTRDVIEVRLDLGGYPVVVSDTAGIRPTVLRVEREGIRRSLATARAADLVIWLMDASSPSESFPPDLKDIANRTLPVLNKIDLLPRGRPRALPQDITAVSVKDGVGLSALIARIVALAADRIGSGAEPVITSVRHRVLIEDAAASLASFLGGKPEPLELRAEDLRHAATALGRITGRVDVEDVLDRVFGRFCIGK